MQPLTKMPQDLKRGDVVGDSSAGYVVLDAPVSRISQGEPGIAVQVMHADGGIDHRFWPRAVQTQPVVPSTVNVDDGTELDDLGLFRAAFKR